MFKEPKGCLKSVTSSQGCWRRGDVSSLSLPILVSPPGPWRIGLQGAVCAGGSHLPNGIGVFYFRLVKQAGRAQLHTVNHFTFEQMHVFLIPVLKV